MTRYLAKRLIQMIPVLLGVTLVAFFIIHLAPGGPMTVLGGDAAQLDPTQVERIEEAYGLNQPLHAQYFHWLSHVLRGDFGISFVESRPVMEMYLERLPNTLYLNGIAILLVYLLAVPLGAISAVKQYSKFDYAVTIFAFAGDALPNFLTALLALYLVAMPSKGAIPMGGIASYGMKAEQVGLWLFLLDRARYLILPLLVVMCQSVTGVTRYMRSSMLEVIREDYVQTARAKGLSERVVIYKHALRNALIPVVTLAGSVIPALFSGSVIVEQIFSWPGVGLLGFRAVAGRDYPVIMAFLTLGSVVTVVSFLVVDLLYVAIDPRIKYE
ncbi:MAG: oligopeptide transporter permease protein [Symbiobacteriaceae bacterium]|nr:oligopeptide transporter permease protein [Symbiobacteriaceae bacterium]